MMLKMNAVRWIFPLAMCYMCVLSSDEHHCETICGENLTDIVTASLGSSVLLPCSFESGRLSSVSWVHSPEGQLVTLTQEGHVKFLFPRDGRLKAFPNQHSQGNYSICIDELKASDLGCYGCTDRGVCLQVKLVPATDARGEEMGLLVNICAGGAALILLSVCSCFFYYKRKQSNTNTPLPADIEGASAPPAEIDRVPVQEQRAPDRNDLIYENDPANPQGGPTRGQYTLPGARYDPNWTPPTPSTSGINPDVNQVNFARVESQRTKQRFHRELFNRLRQASFSRHHYVNQSELRQQAMSAQAENQHRARAEKKERKRRAKDNREYNNPIYNRSTEQLNRQ